MNRVCLIGRLTTKPELRYTGTNIPYTRFSLAVNRTFNNANGEREADFINIVAWKKQAENVVNYLDKGSQVSIEGRIQTGSFTDQNGQKRYTTDVVADNVQFLDSRKNTQAAGSTPYDYQNAPKDVFEDFGENVTIDDNFLD